jgi:hypothetical protein
MAKIAVSCAASVFEDCSENQGGTSLTDVKVREWAQGDG